MTPYSRHNLTEEDIQSVIDVLKSDYLTQGLVVTEFENDLAKYCGAKYAVSSTNATSSLHLSCLALGVTKADLVWVPSLSFIATANCALYCGAEVEFVDVEKESGLISVTALKNKLEAAAKLECLPKVLIVVHLAGQSCQMKEIAELCRQFDIKIIEDASHALGGSYLEEAVGSCRFSDISVFSFHPVKPITSGEGGCMLTNDAVLAEKAKVYAYHGIVRDTEVMIEPNEESWYYEQQYLGYNYRLSDIHAALGKSQLKKVDSRASERAELAKTYIQKLSGLPLKFLQQKDYGSSSWHLFVIQVDKEVRGRLFSELRKNGFGVNLHYIPIPSHPYYKKRGIAPDTYPGAIAYSSSSISLPLYSGMDIEAVDGVVQVIRQFFAK